MPSIFVIGKGISEVKETVGMEHKVEKFLNYIEKSIYVYMKEDKHWMLKKNKSI